MDKWKIVNPSWDEDEAGASEPVRRQKEVVVMKFQFYI